MTTGALSVLLPVYAGAPVTPFREALRSLATQVRQADEVVVVEDGPLLEGHRAALEGFAADLPLKRVALEERRGISGALQAGLDAARGGWIARVDADDISLPRRFADQMGELGRADHDVLGSAMYEFEVDPARPFGVRRMPTTHADIARMMVKANPMNHPTVVLRRSAALGVGGYRGPDGLEDYDLWVRLLLAKARFHNLPEPLVSFRSDGSMIRRRRAMGLMGAELDLQRRFHAYGFLTRRQAAANVVARNTYRLLPGWAMRRVNRIIFPE